MRTSSRAGWELAPNRLSAQLARRRKAGAAVFDLTESNPTRAGIVYPEEEIRAALSAPGVLGHDPAPRGLEATRAAVAAYYLDRGARVEPDQVLLTASTSEAYAWIFKLLCDPGDRVLVPAPSYPLFDFLARLESVRAEPYPLAYHGGWEIDLAELERRANQGAAPRAILVVSPNNPTGNFLKRRELETMRGLSRDLGPALIADEVFGDYPWGPDPERVATVAAEDGLLTFTLSGLSKVAGLPQLKLGWMVVSGPGSDKALERLEVIADTYLSVSGPAQVAAGLVLPLRGQVATQIAERVANNRRVLAAALGDDHLATILRAEGGWYATLRLPATRSEEEWALRLLDADGVFVHPGFFFDFPREAYLVLSLLTPAVVFQEGVERLVARVDSEA